MLEVINLLHLIKNLKRLIFEVRSLYILVYLWKVILLYLDSLVVEELGEASQKLRQVHFDSFTIYLLSMGVLVALMAYCFS